MRILTFFASILMSLSVFAADCGSDAVEAAKMNLDQVAHKYGHPSSYVVSPATFVKDIKVKVAKDVYETLSVFSVDGFIYKGNYSVTVIVDSACAIRTIKVREINAI